MFRNPAYRTIFGVWLAWAVIMLAYQGFVQARVDMDYPDYAQAWTAEWTNPRLHKPEKYLAEPFMNNHAAWDSEYYLGIADGGYDNPEIRTNRPEDGAISLNYAFFPLYPLVMRVVMVPLSLLGMNAVATGTLAGVIVSMLGTLAGMLAIYELTREKLEEAGGLRAAFYLIIFPSGFFLAQVYTEGLFVGLAFWSLVMIKRDKIFWGALLAILATFTRAVGVTLVIPLIISWFRKGDWAALDMEWRQIYHAGLPWRAIREFLIALSPAIAFLIWRMSHYGLMFAYVEETYFGRGVLAFAQTFGAWREAWRALISNNRVTSTYFAIEWFGLIIGFVSCLWAVRRDPEIGLFGLAVVFLSFTSGASQGIYRYVLGAPPVFMFLAHLGKNRVFDRGWTIISTVVMGMLALLFTFDMWTG
jgi:hypothetical protein